MFTIRILLPSHALATSTALTHCFEQSCEVKEQIGKDEGVHDPEQSFRTERLKSKKQTKDGLQDYTEEDKKILQRSRRSSFMFFQYGTNAPENPSEEVESQYWAQQLQMYLAPYSERLDAYLDRRVVGNLTASVAGIVQMRSAFCHKRVRECNLWARARRSRHESDCNVRCIIRDGSQK